MITLLAAASMHGHRLPQKMGCEAIEADRPTLPSRTYRESGVSISSVRNLSAAV